MSINSLALVVWAVVLKLATARGAARNTAVAQSAAGVTAPAQTTLAAEDVSGGEMEGDEGALRSGLPLGKLSFIYLLIKFFVLSNFDDLIFQYHMTKLVIFF